jgi:hypothetical protein
LIANTKNKYSLSHTLSLSLTTHRRSPPRRRPWVRPRIGRAP